MGMNVLDTCNCFVFFPQALFRISARLIQSKYACTTSLYERMLTLKVSVTAINALRHFETG